MANTEHHPGPSCEHFTYVGKLRGYCSHSPYQMRKLRPREGKELFGDHTVPEMPHCPWHRSLHPTRVQHSLIPSVGRNTLHFLLTPFCPSFLHSLKQTGEYFTGDAREKKENKRATSVTPENKKLLTFSTLQVTSKLNKPHSPESCPEHSPDHKVGRCCEGTSRRAQGSCPGLLQAKATCLSSAGRPRPGVVPPPVRCGCLECGNGNLPCQLLTVTYSAAARTLPAAGVPQEMAGLWEQARSQRGLFCQQSLWGKEIKGLLTHQTRGLRHLNGLKRKLEGNKDSSPVTSYPGMGHLFADGARAGCVPTASPALGLHLPASFRTSQSKDGLLPPRRWGASSQRQGSLMIKHCCWIPQPALEAQLNG